MTSHYTGTNVDYTDRVTTEVIHQIQRIFSDTKPFEYNYVIGQEANDEIYEFAGKFRAAHSAGENDTAFGVLFLLGVDEQPTELMIKKWQWLRDVLIADGSLRPDVDQRPHYAMPGAATTCHGPHLDAVWSQMLEPYEEKKVNNPEFPKLIKLQGQNGAFAQWAGFKTWIPTPAARDAFAAVYGLQLRQVESKDMFRAAGPIVGPKPIGYDQWGIRK